MKLGLFACTSTLATVITLFATAASAQSPTTAPLPPPSAEPTPAPAPPPSPPPQQSSVRMTLEATQQQVDHPANAPPPKKSPDDSTVLHGFRLGYGYVTSRMGMHLQGDPRDIALREAIPALRESGE